MKIELDISAERIANMMVSAIESGDPVTTASRGGWCNGINLLKGGEAHDCWYADPKLYEPRSIGSDWLELEVIEVDDETAGHETKHRIGIAEMQKGLVVMATKFPHLFSQILRDDTDAPCADIFLQCVVFGEEKYA